MFKFNIISSFIGMLILFCQTLSNQEINWFFVKNRKRFGPCFWCQSEILVIHLDLLVEGEQWKEHAKKTCVKPVQSSRQRHQNDDRDIILLSLLLTLNRFGKLLWCFHCWLYYYYYCYCYYDYDDVNDVDDYYCWANTQ